MNYSDSGVYHKTHGGPDRRPPAGQAGFRGLARTADAVIHYLRGDQPWKLGLDYASLSCLNPAIVCLHISAYGRDNERKSWPGYDYLMQAEAGLMSMTGDPEGPPSRMGLSMIDFMTGMTGIVSLLGCVMRARARGKGCDGATCLFHVAPPPTSGRAASRERGFLCGFVAG